MLKKLKMFAITSVALSLFAVALPLTVSADSSCPASKGPTCCGKGDTAYQPSIDLGCKGRGNSILDLMFAVIRFLSIGVGLVIVGSMVYAGLQYIGSRGDPNANAQAVKRIQSNVTALLLFIFAYALVNYVVPGQLLG
jgi:hypothetical protein